MGQRHQIFIKTINPYHSAWDAKEKAKLKKMFGTNKTTVLSFHNQWLYGRSALMSALNVLEFNEGITKKDRMDENSFNTNYNSPFTAKGVQSLVSYKGFSHYMEVTKAILNLITEENEFRGKGWLGSWLLNEEEPNMREMFTHGDNNDGITIIDAIENKYCFMNIYEQEYEEDDFSVIRLPSLKPCSGKEYVEAYNPSKKALARKSYYGEQALKKGEKEFDEFVKKTRKVNNALSKKLSKFKVLTEKELRAMFKKQYAEIDGIKESRNVINGNYLIPQIKKGVGDSSWE